MIPGKILRDYQSTTKCCYTYLILFTHDDDDYGVDPVFVL
jgi:hypothetical protein